MPWTTPASLEYRADMYPATQPEPQSIVVHVGLTSVRRSPRISRTLALYLVRPRLSKNLIPEGSPLKINLCSAILKYQALPL